MAEEQHTATVQDFNQRVIEEFRANAGKVGGPFEGTPLVLVTTTGARSGERRTTPLTYLRDADRILVFASNAGAPADPAWYHNVQRNPEVTVEVGTRTYTATAAGVNGAERDRLYARQAQRIPAYAGYQAATSRIIPVVALYPAGAAPGASRARALGDELVQIHDGLRGQLAAASAALDELRSGRQAAPERRQPAPSLELELRTHCLSFCDALGMHHTREDATFPWLERQFPDLGPALTRLRREHRVVARRLQELRTLLADAKPGDAGKVRADLARLASELETHFEYEEQQLVPLLNSAAAAPSAGSG